ncbi:MAG: 7-cyano-7-deazaguanine synthase [Syntrophales bacterium]|jgi:7-cyano-7-deazaguanine synthase|nr:7-cyano-7-deazaguanine synthase [Syntrophales bacterium]MCK9391123.1 7-cyano-7-deazaguanine synthase [Syntrophales bacterium]
MKDKAYSIISGGMDSTLATFLAKKKYSQIVALFIDWGQKSVDEEWIAVQEICALLEINEIERIEVPIDKWDKSSLTQGDRKEVDDNFMVPERNLVFISLAASYARANGGGCLIVGFNKDDGGYDTSREFVDQINVFFEKGTKELSCYNGTYLRGTKITLEAPLLGYDKKKIAEELKANDLYNLTYTCYAAKGPCGKCRACKKREASFTSYGSKGPT